MHFSWCGTKTADRGTLTLCLALIGLGISAGVSRGGGAGAEPHSAGKSFRVAGRVETVMIRTENLVRSIEMPGSVEGYETADLYAKIGGYLVEISVDIGDHVRQGQELARIDVPEMIKQLDQERVRRARAEAGVEQTRAAIRQAEAEIVRAQAEVDEAEILAVEKRALSRFRQAEATRVEKLVASGALSEEKLDEKRFQLDSAEAALAAALAHVRTAEAAFSASAANRDMAETDLKTARADVDVALAAYERVRVMLDYATIRAPFDAIVTNRWVDRGAFIQPAEGNSAAKPLLRVTHIDTVRVAVDVPMREVGALDRQDRAVLDRINALPGETFEGQVSRFSSSLDPTTRMMRVEIDLENPDGRLLPGYYGYVKLFLEEFPHTPVIPSSALLTRPGETGETGGTFVYVVQNGVCRKRPVKINYQDGAIIGIASGLVGGEQVVRAGGGQLADGQAVVAVPVQRK